MIQTQFTSKEGRKWRKFKEKYLQKWKMTKPNKVQAGMQILQMSEKATHTKEVLREIIHSSCGVNALQTIGWAPENHIYLRFQNWKEVAQLILSTMNGVVRKI